MTDHKIQLNVNDRPEQTKPEQRVSKYSKAAGTAPQPDQLAAPRTEATLPQLKQHAADPLIRQN